jgi:DNA-binding NarL/FixJ family response regulator
VTACSVLIVDDHPVFRLGLSAMLTSLPGVSVVGEAESAARAVELAVELHPDVVLMDLTMPGGSGLEATRRILDLAPGTAVLVVTMHDDEDLVFAALRCGARGYLVKGATRDQIDRALRSVAAGDLVLGAAVAEKAAALFTEDGRGAAAFAELTTREREILRLVGAGLDNAAIARRLVISTKTVKNHLSNVLAKLHLSTRAEAIVRVRESGL